VKVEKPYFSILYWYWRSLY